MFPRDPNLSYLVSSLASWVPDRIQKFIDNAEGDFSMTYYTGDWSKDIYDNFTELQAEKIFKRMAQFQNKISFVQKKNDPSIGGYEYQIARF